MSQIKIIPLLEGTHKIRQEENGVNIFDHTSAVTLIQSEQKNILVDVGGRGRFDLICQKLRELNLTAEDIHFVILTHFHLDHSYNIAFFTNAKVIGWKHLWKEKSTLRLNNLEEFEVANGIKIIKTPGHTEEHISVLIKTEKKNVVISGDAINEKYVQTKEVSAFFVNEKWYRESAEKILLIADEIIPGHGSKILLQS